jgi:hypothetical protein
LVVPQAITLRAAPLTVSVPSAAIVVAAVRAAEVGDDEREHQPGNQVLDLIPDLERAVGHPGRPSGDDRQHERGVDDHHRRADQQLHLREAGDVGAGEVGGGQQRDQPAEHALDTLGEPLDQAVVQPVSHDGLLGAEDALQHLQDHRCEEGQGPSEWIASLRLVPSRRNPALTPRAAGRTQ